MEITIAQNAGFCFGVKRATDSLESAMDEVRSGERIYTLGTLIHNGTYNAMLESRGVRVAQIGEIEALCESATAESPVKVFVRAHGIPREDEELMAGLAQKNRYFSYVDCTCPYVKKIHNIAKKHSSPDNILRVFGRADHPEVVGILSYFEYEKLTYASAEELLELGEKGLFVKLTKKCPILVAQTTQKLAEWRKTQEVLKKVYTNPLIFDTICSVTEQRQTEEADLAA